MLFVILLIVEIFLLYFLSRKVIQKVYRLLRSPYLFAFIFFPGTFVHEISHFLFALFLLVPVGKVELFPKIEDEEIQLGSVAIAKTDPIRRTVIGISPIIVGMSITLGSVYYVYTNNLFNTPWVLVLTGILVFEIGNTMFSSKKDIEGVLPLLIIISIIAIALYVLGLRINWEINTELIKKLNLLILVPIAIDSIIFFL